MVTYTNVLVTRVNPAEVFFQFDGGMANAKLCNLNTDLQKRFGYNADRASVFAQLLTDENEQFELKTAQEFALRATKRRQAAEASERASIEPPFRLTDPLTTKSPLNQPAPAFTVDKWSTEKPPAFADKFVLIYFWNSGSTPCLSFIPQLNDWSKKSPEKLLLIAITTEEVAELQPTEPAIEFSSGTDASGKYAASLGINSVPTLMLIDPRGIVRYIGHPAALTEDALNKLMARFAPAG
jgi:thiol-disulfide isomerase/thioredoxin